jgi:Arc/MetJ-type ribon-helix-helix transcriptional regulator
MAGLIGTFGAGAFTGSKREKLTLSMNAEELKQVDLLVEQGLYPSREAFLQSAARNLLHEHGLDLPQAATGRLTAAGIVMHNRKSLERLLAAGRQVELNVTGILRLSGDVTPELACAVIKQLKVCGAFQASPEVKAALRDRIP